MAKLQYCVVPYRPAHALAWRQLNEAWIREGGFALEAKDRAVLSDPQATVLDKGGYIFMVEDPEGVVVGCCAIQKMDDGGYELAKMTVAPSARGLGLSKILIQSCEDKARELGASRLYLETNSGLKPALKLYESSGFTYLPTRETPYARADVFMEKPLG
ncbi:MULTISPECIES: GNAT family N-acetyltransferase [unclassified Brevundimonas]|uniref:GNAT family N-acetyltransferase n=1 Tax=unclassified Brevundimonas TaxID=2622653 RepID=UPI0025B8DBC2|nr:MULTISPECIES: GNAT family N-acetyltransferase [unclassified Brevundimonas]